MIHELKWINLLQDETSETVGGQVVDSLPSSFFGFDLQTPATSVYSPNEAEDPLTSECKPLEKLNIFLESRDVSLLRYPMKIQWEDASERTRSRHIRKANQVVDAVLDEVAPNQSDQLWKSLAASKSLDQHPVNNNDERVDEVLMEALAECYRNASNWRTRRQILSIMADTVSYKALKKWIPNLTIEVSVQRSKKTYPDRRQRCGTITEVFPDKNGCITDSIRSLS